jgi:expansin
MRGLAVACAVAGLAGCATTAEPPPVPAPPRCLGQLAAIGAATYYDATGLGSCSLEAVPPPARTAKLSPDASAKLSPDASPDAPADARADRLVAAVNAADYDHAALCGACLAVAGPLGAVVVRVVDSCPGCRRGDLDLSREAFAAIAPLSAGRTKVAWRTVACPVTGPIVYRIKPGSNPSWTAFQLRNHRYPIAGLEVRDTAGAYRAISRGDDNYFVAHGLGAGPYALRVTDRHGHALDDAIALGDAARPGAAQLPSCP